MSVRFSASLCAMIVVGLGASTARAGDGAPSYSRDVRPILASTCFKCHGPDEGARQAELRLDTPEGAAADRDGKRAIVPGNLESSELVRRITNADPAEKMPPSDSGKSLTAAQIDTLRRWVQSGGKYEKHWAFVPPSRPAVPAVKNTAWPRNEIDRFVLARLEAEGLGPSPEADRYALVRRVYLDLIGLPPTPEEADAFVADRDPQAYEMLVERLLASQHYGERWARPWLDLARYSDTNGYEKDRNRSIWPYRDWVIRALNADMPFDQFTIEQLAGDMLPGATLDQRSATGFHRNTMLNEEGGIDPLEFRFHAMVDRVATTGTVWLGLSLGCAQCHSHKYDPISHTDYYRVMGLLNNADEPDVNVPDPAVAQRRREIEEQIAGLEAALPQQFPPTAGVGPIEARRKQNFESALARFIDAERARATAWTVLRPHEMKTNLPKLEVLADGSIYSTGDITKRDVFTLKLRMNEVAGPVTALRLEVLPDERLPGGGPGRAYYEGQKGDFFLSDVSAKVAGKPVAFHSASVSYGQIAIGSGDAKGQNVFDGDGSTGWSTAQREGQPHQLVLNFAQPLDAAAELELEMLFERHFAASLGRFRLSATSATTPPVAKDMPVEVEAALARDPATWSNAERSTVQRHFLNTAPELAEARKQIDQLQSQLPAYPTTMVFEARPADNPRHTVRYHRGEYLQPREEVSPGLPEFLAGSAGGPSDRLAFARWLVSEKDPLAARVTVNRAWQAFFGSGIVRSTGDFGTQAELPSHPELLDWLACEFVDGGWSLKKLHRMMVCSAAYRQSAHVSPELLARDPQNRLLARGPRVRVEAEIVRDLVLAASGLLSAKMGGPSVYPPQPDSVTALSYGEMKWDPSAGEDRYRRSLYTFSKRTAPFAAYLTFDAPTGENCVAARERSNTPLQALTLLNDEMFLEASRALAARAAAAHSDSPQLCATSIFRRLLTRPPAESELADLLQFRDAQLSRLKSGELDAAAICKEQPPSPELAAWVMVARALMNLDETVTK
ncbi:MAG: PSD1 and planctomycete cytochrome C domain-containing protein [Planctomycetaceae bacterium]